MSGGSALAGAGADAVDFELEAMKKEDCSWHPCQVSLCPNGAGLVVHYGNTNSKDILVSEKEALMRLRGRSLPLQDDDCTQIKEGDHLVVNRNSQSESAFFDAVAEKVIRVRHSKRVHCRCTFMIKWLHQDLNEGSLIVPSSSIMKLANKSIKTHPTISAFLDAGTLSNSSFSIMSPLANVVNDIDLDLHEILGKQIEGIRNSVDASKKKIRDEILGLEAHTEEQAKDISVSNAMKPNIQNSKDMSHLRRSTRSRKTMETAEVKDPPSPVFPTPSIQEELRENRSPLNPLAARAALASLMSKLPQSLETSFIDEEGEDLSDSSGVIARKQHKAESLNVTKCFSTVIDKFSMVNKLSSETEAVVNLDRIVKSLFSTESQSDMSQSLEVSPTVSMKQAGKAHKEAGDTDISTNVLELRVDKNTSSSATNRRFTRSALHKEGEGQAIETTTVIEELTTSGNKVIAKGRYTSKDKKTVLTTSMPVSEINSLQTDGKKGLVKTEQGDKENDIKGKTCTVDMKKSSDMKRLTRSSAKKEAENLNIKAIQESGGDVFPRIDTSELSGGTVSISDTNMVQKTNPITLPFHGDTNLAPAEGRMKMEMSVAVKGTQETESTLTSVNVDLLPTNRKNMKRKTSAVVIETQDSEGAATSDSGHSRSKRRSADLKKHELRLSPRLRFLPKTRSQK